MIFPCINLFCDVSLMAGVHFRLLSEILKETSEDIEEIEYLTDGSWRPIRDEKERERERERSNTPDYPVVDICKFSALSHPLVCSCFGGVCTVCVFVCAEGNESKIFFLTLKLYSSL